MTTLKQADPRGLLIDQTTFICSCSPFTPKVCCVCGADTKHTTTQSWTRMNTSTHTVVWPFCPFVPYLKKGGGGISTWKHDNFVLQMHLTFSTCSTNTTGCHLYKAGWGQTSKNNKDSPSESSETLMCTKLLLDTLSVSYNEMIGSQIALADVFLSPSCLLLLLLSWWLIKAGNMRKIVRIFGFRRRASKHRIKLEFCTIRTGHLGRRARQVQRVEARGLRCGSRHVMSQNPDC